MLSKSQKLRMFATGIIVRLAGVVLIVLGDGHNSLWAKALVVLGVIVTVTGMGILRYLLFSPLLSKVKIKTKASQ
jgi:hypothetical protein